jgi:hypothetical protein
MGKNQSNGNVKVAWILDSALPLKQFPLATTLNTSSLDLSEAIAWQDYAVGADNSADVEDRSIVDLGNAVSRGAASYAATLSMFRDLHSIDVSSIYVQAFEAFRVERTLGWLVVRVNKPATEPWAAGDEISLFKLLADTIADTTEGDSSTKFTVTFLPQGTLYVHTMVGGAGVITGVPTTLAKTVAGGAFQLLPILAGSSIVSRAEYSSSDTTKAQVSLGGTVTPVATGTSTITTSFGAGTAPISTVLTIS